MIDLTAELFRVRSKPRGDELTSHFSDLYTCHRAVSYRRRGLKPMPFTPERIAKFQSGHDFEYGVARTLREAGHKVEHGPDFTVSGWGLDIGHPDILVDDALVIDCKTTDARKPKDEVQPHHAIQVAAFALALAEERGLPPLQAVVLVRHASHVETLYPVAPEPLRASIEALAVNALEVTDPLAEMPPAVPTAWLPYKECSYCDWYQCPSHPKGVPL